MTQEDKNLLLKDISARLPYGTIVSVTDGTIKYDAYIESISYKYIQVSPVSDSVFTPYTFYKISEIKPYLRPMSSMTEEECDMVEEILGDKCIFDFMSNGDIILKQGQFSQNKLAKLYDYYASIHVDYRGLIPKGLALEAPEGIYKKEK